MNAKNLLPLPAPEKQAILQPGVGGGSTCATKIQELLSNTDIKILELATQVYNTLRNIDGLEGTGLRLLEGATWRVHYTELVSRDSDQKEHYTARISITDETKDAIRSLVCKLYKTLSGDISTIGKVQGAADGSTIPTVVPLGEDDYTLLEDFLAQIKPGIGFEYKGRIGVFYNS